MPDQEKAIESGQEVLQPLKGRDYLIAEVGFETELDALRKAVGEELKPLPDNLTDEQLLRMQYEMLDASGTWDLRQLYRYREIQAERRRRQLKFEQNTTGTLRQEEYIVWSQALTQSQYLPATATQVVDFLDAYNEQVDPFVMSLPEEQRTQILRKKIEAAQYEMVLKDAMQERVLLGQLMMTEYKLAEVHATVEKPVDTASALEKNDHAERTKRQAQYKTKQADLMLERQRIVKELTEIEGRRLVALPKHKKDDVAAEMKYADLLKEAPLSGPLSPNELLNRQVRARQLDQLLVEILAGVTAIPNVTSGFLPQNLYGDAMPMYYTQILDGTTKIAEQNKGSDKIAHGRAMEQLSEIRKQMMEQMVLETNARGQYQIAISEMLSTQKLLGVCLVTEGTTTSNPIDSDPTLREQIGKMVEEQKQGHIGYMKGMVEAVQSGFFEVPADQKVKEWVFEKLFKDLTVETLADKLGNYFSMLAVLPGLQGALKRKLTQPLKEAFYYDKEQKRMLDPNNPEDMARIQERLKLVTESVATFQESGTTQNFSDTLDSLSVLPPISQFADGKVDASLIPAGRISFSYVKRRVEDKTKPLTADEGKTLYDALEKQKQADFNAFMTAYETFLNDIEKIIDVRIDLKAALKQMQDEWADLAKWIAYGAGGAIALPFVAYRLYQLARFGASAAWKGSAAFARGSLRSAPASAAFIMHGFRTFEHIGEWSEHSQLLEQEKGLVVAELVAAGFVKDESQDDLYVYKDGDVEVKVSVTDMTQSLDTRKWEDWIRIGGDVAEGGILAWGMKVGKLRKAALPYVLVECGVKVINERVKRGAQFNAISKFPPWLVALLHLRGTFEPAMGNSAFEIAGKQPQSVREKMVWAVFNQEVAVIPDWEQQIYPGGQNVHDLKEYFDIPEGGDRKGKFFDEILLIFYPMLYREFGTRRATYESIQTCDIANNFTYVEVREVMRKAIILYIENLKERRLADALIALRMEKAKDKPDAIIIAILESVVESLGDVTVFGQKLSALKLDTLSLEELTAYKTRGIRIGEILSANAQNSDREAVQAQIQEVLRGTGFVYSSRNLINLVGDEITRFNVENIQPLTASEGEPVVKPDWYHELVPGQNNEETVNFGGRRMSEVHQAYYLDALTVLQEAARGGAPDAQSSIAKCQQEITVRAAQLIASNRDLNPKIKQGVTGKLTLTRKGNQPPIEFSKFSHWSPELRDLPPAFRELTVLAHFQEAMPVGKRHYEGGTKDLGESVVLSTVVLGDPLDPKKMVVIQWAMVDWYFLNKRIEMEDFAGLRYLPIFKDERDLYNELTEEGKFQGRCREFMVGQPVISSGAAFAANERGGQAIIDYVLERGRQDASIDARNARRDEQVAAELPAYEAEVARIAGLPADAFATENQRRSNQGSRTTDAYVITPVEVTDKTTKRTSRRFIYMRSYHPDRRGIREIENEQFVIRVDDPRKPVIRRPGDGPSMEANPWGRRFKEVGGATYGLPEKSLSFLRGTQKEFDAGTPHQEQVKNLFTTKFTAEEYRMCRAVLTTPFSADAPSWFHEHTIQTLLYRCAVKINKGADMQFFTMFQMNIIDLYLSSYDKQAFLEKLFDLLMEGEERGLLTSARTSEILTKMQSAVAAGDFRNAVQEFDPNVRSSISFPGGCSISVLPIYVKVKEGDRVVDSVAYDVSGLPRDSVLEVNVPDGADATITAAPGGKNRHICKFGAGTTPPEGTTVTIKNDKGEVISRNYPLKFLTKSPEVPVPEGLLKKE